MSPKNKITSKLLKCSNLPTAYSKMSTAISKNILSEVRMC